MIRFDPLRLPEICQRVREDVRAFLAAEAGKGVFVPNEPLHPDTDAQQFARDAGAAGYIGMTWPRQYGGHQRSYLEKYVVTEEFRIAQAPTERFFTADRQSGPMILKYGAERLKTELIPKIVAGELTFCIGMSEANSGSDLFAAQARATAVDGGWRLNGTKLWTSGAHIADYTIALMRTSAPTKENHRHGLTQFLVPMRIPGITVNPVLHINGRRQFNEVVFEDAVIPADHALGVVDDAWKQATSELAYERSGPERFLAEYGVLSGLVGAIGAEPDRREAEGIGRLVAQLHTIRRMSVSVNGMLAAGKEPTVEGSMVKELGTLWQQDLAIRARDLAAFCDADRPEVAAFRARLDESILTSPQITIQGGTTEVLRGIIARELGLR